jgi:hypothetical protein
MIHILCLTVVIKLEVLIVLLDSLPVIIFNNYF